MSSKVPKALKTQTIKQALLHVSLKYSGNWQLLKSTQQHLD